MGKIGKKIGIIFLSLLIAITKTVLIVPRGTCRFHPTCSEYARGVVSTMPFYRACFLIAKRLIKCTPFSLGGYDPVPQTKGKAR